MPVILNDFLPENLGCPPELMFNCSRLVVVVLNKWKSLMLHAVHQLCLIIGCEEFYFMIKGALGGLTSSPTFSNKSSDFFTIRSVCMGKDYMLSFMFQID